MWKFFCGNNSTFRKRAGKKKRSVFDALHCGRQCKQSLSQRTQSPLLVFFPRCPFPSHDPNNVQNPFQIMGKAFNLTSTKAFQKPI